MQKKLLIAGKEITLSQIAFDGDTVSFEMDGARYAFAATPRAGGYFDLRDAGGASHENLRGYISRKNKNGEQRAFIRDVESVVAAPSSGRKKGGGGTSGGSLAAPMPGVIQKILVSAGDEVEAGDALLVMEAMKLQLTIQAPHAGVVEHVYFKEKDLVKEGVELVRIKQEASDAA